MPFVKVVAVDNGRPRNTYTTSFIEKDGNCLFRCLSQHLFGHQNQHADIRQKCKHFLDQNMELVKSSIFAESFEEARSFLERQASLDVFGEEVMIAAFVHLFKRPVTVYSSGYNAEGENIYHNLSLVPNSADLSQDQSCRLVLDMCPQRPHYELLLDLPDPNATSPLASASSTSSNEPVPQESLRSENSNEVASSPEDWDSNGSTHRAGVSESVEFEDELDDEANEPTSSARSQPRESRKDPISLYLLDQLGLLKSGVKFTSQLQNGNNWIIPDNPTSKAVAAFFRTGVFHPEFYYYPSCFVWAPHISFPDIKFVLTNSNLMLI
jgi:hypothetical protein